MTKIQKIGVFDSGIGGLTVLSELRKQMPGVDYVYLGDTARVPYGTKSPGVVRRYALECAWYLREQGVDTIVIACNSASAAAKTEVESASPGCRVFDVIEPGAKSAVEASSSRKIGVLGTHATIASGKYTDAITTIDSGAEVTAVACPLFVPLAEEGEVSGSIAQAIADKYLKKIIDAGCDVVLLGCTHYPLLREVIQRALGDDVHVVDSAEPLAQEVAAGQATGRGGSVNLYTTDDPERFIAAGNPFLGAPVPLTQFVDLEMLVLQEQHRTGNLSFLGI